MVHTSGSFAVVGVSPQALARKKPAGSTKLKVVGSTNERERRVADLSDAFFALPGGMETLEEIFEGAPGSGIKTSVSEGASGPLFSLQSN